MLEEIKEQARAAVLELLESARLSRGDILVVGCSSSEVMGGRIGAASSTQAAAAVFAGIYPVLCQNGIYLAAQCCEHLNRALIVEREAAEKYGLNPEEVKANDEKVNRSLLYSVAAAVENFRGNDRGMLPYRIYQAQAETIRRLSMEGPCIFIGRCAGEILKEKRRSLNVFIYASSMAERRERANQIDNIPMTDADSYIHMKDKQRRDYYKMYAEKEWGDPLNYDLCMNSSALGYDRCVELIERAVRI